MKLIKTLIFCLFLSIGYGQTLTEWFPVGAEYYYDYIAQVSVELPFDTGSYKLTVSKDTIIKGKVCKILKGEHTTGRGVLNSNIDDYVILNEDNRLFFYVDSLFLPIYDFNLSVGDTGVISEFYYYDSFYYVIDSFSFHPLYNSIRLQHIHILDNLNFGCWIEDFRTIAEYLGDIRFLFSFSDAGCDGAFPSRLRCYRDGVNDLTFIDRPCDYIVNKIAPQQIIQSQIKIYPNPSFTILKIENLSNKKVNVSIYNAFGQLLNNFNLMEGLNSVDVSNFVNGNYFLVSSDNFVKPFIKM